jgi:hypothetical protein
MSEKVDNLIEQEKDRLEALKKQMRDRHLISLGLLDEGKSERKYSNTLSGHCKWDEEKKMYYTESICALTVTDEEYLEICKYYPPSQSEEELKKSVLESNSISQTKSLKTIKNIAVFYLVITIIGIIAWLIILIETATSF